MKKRADASGRTRSGDKTARATPERAEEYHSREKTSELEIGIRRPAGQQGDDLSKQSDDPAKLTNDEPAVRNDAGQQQERHGWKYQQARHEFMRRSLDDPNTPDHIKGWIRQEIQQRGERGYWRSPKGYDVGHKIPGVNTPENLRWELAADNRWRGGKQHR